MKQPSFLSKIKNFIYAHKFISGIIGVVIIFCGYGLVKAFSSSTTQTTYVISAAEKGTVVATVSGSGQVSASNEVDITSKVSGDLVSLNAVSGQEVKSGTLLAQVDSRNAAIDLENAQLTLQKLTDPDSLSVTEAQDAVETAKQDEVKSEQDLASNYAGALSSVASSFVDFPTIIQGLNTMFYTSSGTLNDIDSAGLPIAAQQYRNDAGVNLDRSKDKYSANLLTYHAITADSTNADTEKIIDQTLDTAETLMVAVKNAKSTIDYLKNTGKEGTLKNFSTAQTNLNTWLDQISGDVTSLTTVKNNIQNGKVAIDSATRNVSLKQSSLDALHKDSSDVDVRSQQLTIDQRQQAYSDYFIRAPFDGVIAKVNVKSTDSVNSGTSIATLISKQQVAEISLNEVDISKIKVGQSVTLTFDAVDGLTITGKVVEADLIGTVSQGVVSYAVKIAFDTSDPRVLSGMSVNAVIATDIKQDVIVVPNSAIKTQGTTSYVELVDPSVQVSATAQTLSVAPTQQEVTVGLSDDTNTEIVSGLAEGDKVVTKTVTATAAKKTTASAPSLFGGGAAGGGAARGLTGGAARTGR